MRDFEILKDHVRRFNDRNGRHPLIEGLAVVRLAGLALGVAKHRSYLERHEGITYRKTSDYDCYTLEDDHEIMYGEMRNDASYLHDTYIKVRFESVGGDEYDYVALAARSTATAYKRGRQTTPVETKFKAVSATVVCKNEDAETWALAETVRLAGVLDRLEASVATLEAWVASGMAMRLMCPTLRCRPSDEPAMLSNKSLAALMKDGSSLPHMKEKLVCRKCGARNSGFQAW